MMDKNLIIRLFILIIVFILFTSLFLFGENLISSSPNTCYEVYTHNGDFIDRCEAISHDYYACERYDFIEREGTAYKEVRCEQERKQGAGEEIKSPEAVFYLISLEGKERKLIDEYEAAGP